MATRYTAGEGMSDPGNPQTREGSQSSEPTPQRVPQQGSMRVLYNTETGEATVQESRPSGAVVSPSVEQASARNSAGQPIPLSMAGPNDVLDIPGYGNSLASVYEQMGLVVRDGNGYKLVNQPAVKQISGPSGSILQQDGQADGNEKSVRVDAPSPAGDVRGVEPTSNQTDATLKAITERTPMALEGLVTSLSESGELPDALLEDIAKQHDTDPAEFKAQVSSMVDDHVRAGRQAVKAVDATINLEAFQAWLLRDPELANKVTRGILNKRVTEIQDAARTYVANRDGAIESALVGKGIETKRDGGKLYMSRAALGLAPKPRMGEFPASDWISVDEAEIGRAHV